MKSKEDGVGYNQRLFSGGLRARLHLARFHWFVDEMTRLGCDTSRILELGCFDGKLLGYLPNEPDTYVGFDANWEGGLDLAKAAYGDRGNCHFYLAKEPSDMDCLTEKDTFSVAVAMETLEHVPPDLVDGYLQKIAQHLDGFLFVTVPNEKGILFLAKWMIKQLLTKDAKQYTARELFNATLGRMQHVERNEHKGFDYEQLVRQIQQYFDVLDVSGHPLGFLPTSLCFGAGIIAKSRDRSSV